MSNFRNLLLLLIIICLRYTMVSSQEISRSVISFGGTEYRSVDGFTLDATMGEIVIEQFVGPYVLTQGFQQGDLLDGELPETPEIDATVFPNPFDESLQIMITLDADLEMRVYDVLGQIVYTAIPETEEFMISTSDWPTGMYFVNFNAGGKRLFVEKVIKQATN